MRRSTLNVAGRYCAVCKEAKMWVPFDLKIVSMVMVLMLIVLFAGLWAFHFWIERHEEHLFRDGPRDSLPHD